MRKSHLKGDKEVIKSLQDKSLQKKKDFHIDLSCLDTIRLDPKVGSITSILELSNGKTLIMGTKKGFHLYFYKKKVSFELFRKKQVAESIVISIDELGNGELAFIEQPWGGDNLILDNQLKQRKIRCVRKMIKFSKNEMLTVHSKCCRMWKTNTTSWLDMKRIFTFKPKMNKVQSLINAVKIEDKLFLLDRTPRQTRICLFKIKDQDFSLIRQWKYNEYSRSFRRFCIINDKKILITPDFDNQSTVILNLNTQKSKTFKLRINILRILRIQQYTKDILISNKGSNSLYSLNLSDSKNQKFPIKIKEITKENQHITLMKVLNNKTIIMSIMDYNRNVNYLQFWKNIDKK